MGLVEQRRARQLSKLAEIDHAVDAKVFSNILDLDDDADENFSRSLVFDFFDLARHTLEEMDACLKQTDSEQLADKARYLRGPCNTLGIYKMEGICARIEQLATNGTERTLRCTTASLIMEARERFLEAEKALLQLY